MDLGFGWIGWVGIAGVTVLVIGWLVVSFSAPGPRREVVEWISACGMYVALLMLFVNLCLRAREAGSTAALVAFGFLGTIFACGLAVSLVLTASAMRGGGPGTSSPTN